MFVRFLSFVVSFFFLNVIYSQTCCSGGVPISSNIGLPVLDKGTFQVGVNYDYNNLNTLNEGSNKLSDASRKRVTNSYLLSLGYNITNNWTVEGMFTWVNQKREVFSAFGTSLSETSGFGDFIILSKYQYLNKNNFKGAFGFGFKLPTGRHDIKNSQGIAYNADLQPGTNTLDYLFLTSLSKKFEFRKSFVLSTRLIYRLTGVNDEYQKVNMYKFGNELQVFLTGSDQFILLKQLIDTALGVKYRKVDFDSINNNPIPNTGGEWFFLIPSVSYNLNSNTRLNLSTEIPIFSKVNGIQLTPTNRLTIGVVVEMFKSNSLNKYL